MTDLLGLKLTADSTEFVRGVRSAALSIDELGDKIVGPAARNLDELKDKFDAAGTKAARFEGSLNKVYSMRGAFGGTLNIAQDITSIEEALKRADVAGASFAGSRLFLEVGKTGLDFRELTAGVKGSTSALGALFTIAKANPLVTLSLVVGAIGAAMALFASKTSKAREELKRLVDDQKQLSVERQASKDLGLFPEESSNFRKRELDEIRKAYESLLRLREEQKAEPVSVADFSKSVGRGQLDIFRALAGGNYGGQSAAAKEYLQTGQLNRPLDPFNLGAVPSAEVGNFVRLTPAQQQDLLKKLFEGVKNQPEAFPNIQLPGDAIYQAGVEYTGRQEVDKLRKDSVEQDLASGRALDAQEAFTRQQEAIERWKESLQELREGARAFGEELGDGVFDALKGLRSGKDILAAMVNDIQRISIRSATGNLFSAAADAAGKAFNPAPSAKAQDESAFFE